MLLWSDAYHSHFLLERWWRPSNRMCIKWWHILTVCYYHVSYEFQSESKLLGRSRRHIWSLSDSNAIRTHKQLVRKWTKWLNVPYELSGCGFESLCGDTYVREVWSRLRTKSNGIPWSDITREISCW